MRSDCFRVSVPVEARKLGSRRVRAVASLAVIAVMSVPSAAESQLRGDPMSGSEIAQRWCADCHMVSPDQPIASPDVPTFMEIVRRAPDDLSTLQGFLADPHPPMPEMSLTRQEIRDLIAYLATLR
jgi:cytochrome c2